MNPYTSFGRSSSQQEDEEEYLYPSKNYGSKETGKVKRRNPYTSYGYSEDEDKVDKEDAKLTFRGLNNKNTTATKKEYLETFQSFNPKSKAAFLKKLKENAEGGDEESQQILGWIDSSGATKGGFAEAASGFADKLGGGLGRGVLRTADALLPGKNTFGLEGAADEWDRRYQEGDIASQTEWGQRGETGGHLAKAVVDVASLAMPTSYVDKAVKGTRAIQALEKGGRVAKGAGYVARTIPGSIVGSGVDVAQEIGRGNDINPVRSGAIGLGADLALPAVAGIAGRGAKAGINAVRGAGPITDQSRLLGSGVETAQKRLAEIDSELDEIMNNPNYTYRADTGELGTTPLANDPDALLTGGRPTQAGAPDRRTTGKAGVVAPSDEIMDSSLKAERARELMRERRATQQEVERLSLREIPDDVTPTQAAQDNPTVARAVDNDMQETDRFFSKVDDNYTPGFLGRISTQERVFQRAGLGDLYQVVREGHDRTIKATNTAYRQLNEWAGRLDSPESSKRLFKAMNGEQVDLSPQEQSIVEEARAMLQDYAERQGLPPERRLVDYIPHIFDNKSKRIDPELARLMRKNASADVSNPFLKRRLGAEDYKEDFFEAMQVYSSRAERQINMQEGVGLLQESKAKVSQGMADFVNDQINLIKSIPDEQSRILSQVDDTLAKAGIKPGTVARGSQMARNIIYRATMGFNFGTPLRNLSQGANTFSQLGPRWTVTGYAQATQALVGRNLDELVDMNVLDDSLERALRGGEKAGIKSTARNVADKGDNALWAMFDASEKLNRASAYYGAKAKAIAKGASEADARKAGAAMARKTQFKFSKIDTPQLLQGEITKNLTQFQSFNIKQVEFIKDMVVGSEGMFQKTANGWKLSPQGALNLGQWIGANTAFMITAGSLIGMEPEDFIPFYRDIMEEGSLPTSPLVQLTVGDSKNLGLSNIISGENQYGNEESRLDIAKDFAKDELFGLAVPGGSQIKKTLQGMDAVDEGGSYTEAGRLRFPVSDEGTNPLRAGLFGQYSTPEGQDYLDRDAEPLSDKQSEIIRELGDRVEQRHFYDFFTGLKKAPPKKQATEDIRAALAGKNYEKAKRITATHNAEIDALLEDLESKVDTIPEDLKDYVNDFRVSYDYYVNEARRK